MSNTVKASVIIPIYNAEKYLENTLQSIKDQSYKNFEVLMIDDGSTDSSTEICRKFEIHDSRFRLIKKTNGGVSSARNIGIEHAIGELLFFVDSDDIIEKEAIERCVLIYNTNKPDMIVFGMLFDVEKGGTVRKTLTKSCAIGKVNDSNRSDKYIKMAEENYIQSMCNRCVKREIIDRWNLRFNENITNYEDMLFVLQYMRVCNSFVCIPECYYHYIMRDDLGMSRKYKPGLFDNLQETVSSLQKAIMQLNLEADVEKYALVDTQRLLWLGVSNICRSSESCLQKKRRIKKLCNESWVKKKPWLCKNGNKYNDINIMLVARKKWLLMVWFNSIINWLRDIKY